MRLRLLLLLIATPSLLAAQPLQVDGLRFDTSFYLMGHKVNLNGVAAGQVEQARAYTAALYLVKPARTVGEALASPGPKRLQLQLQREISSQQLGSLLSRTLQANLPPTELSVCLPGLAQIGELMSAKKRLNPGDQLLFDGVMSQGTHITINGERVGLIKGAAFFDCLLKGYLGPQAVDPGLRQGLLSPRPVKN